MSLRYTSALLTLATPNFNTLVQFYSQLLNLQPVELRPNIYAEFQLATLKLGIFRPKETLNSKLSTQSSTIGMSLCLEVEDLEAAIAHLTQLGYPPPGAVLTASHGKEIYAYDPDGNRLVLHQA